MMVSGIFVEIRQHDHDAAPVQEILEMDERLGEIGMRAHGSAFSMACSSRNNCPCRVEGAT